MAKINAKVELHNIETLEELVRFSSIALANIRDQVNGNLTFQDNISNRIIGATFVSANTTLQIQHSLGRVPLMWLTGNVSADSVIYQTREADQDFVYLAASAACGAKILLI